MDVLQEIKIQYNPKSSFPSIVIKTSEDIEGIARHQWDGITVHESMYCFYLNRANKIIGVHKISQGGVNATVVDPKIIMAAALKTLGSGIVLLHNHPSGNLIPSRADKILTKKIKNACEFMDIQLLDHLILSPFGGYYSFADERLL